MTPPIRPRIARRLADVVMIGTALYRGVTSMCRFKLSTLNRIAFSQIVQQTNFTS
jgi:hypothetical protein